MDEGDDDQHAKFIKAARELGTDDDPEAFKQRLKKLMDAPPPDENVPGSRKKQHASDCALHNGPAMNTGPCDCGADD